MGEQTSWEDIRELEPKSILVDLGLILDDKMYSFIQQDFTTKPTKSNIKKYIDIMNAIYEHSDEDLDPIVLNTMFMHAGLYTHLIIRLSKSMEIDHNDAFRFVNHIINLAVLEYGVEFEDFSFLHDDPENEAKLMNEYSDYRKFV